MLSRTYPTLDNPLRGQILLRAGWWPPTATSSRCPYRRPTPGSAAWISSRASAPAAESGNSSARQNTDMSCGISCVNSLMLGVASLQFTCWRCRACKKVCTDMRGRCQVAWTRSKRRITQPTLSLLYNARSMFYKRHPIRDIVSI